MFVSFGAVGSFGTVVSLAVSFFVVSIIGRDFCGVASLVTGAGVLAGTEEEPPPPPGPGTVDTENEISVFADMLPRLSVEVRIYVYVPSTCSAIIPIDQFPDASTVPVPRTVPEAFLRVMIAPTSPVPVIVGVVSAVVYVAVASSPTDVTTGEIGAVASSVNTAVTVPTLPTLSVIESATV